MKNHILLVVLPFVLFSLNSCKTNIEKKPYLIVVSIDGCRWDYPDRTFTPTLDSIEKHGVRAVSLKPSFPTKTFPNHYSIATGLYPDNHGIVQNLFYAPKLEKSYTIRDRNAVENPEFYGGEPIWVTAERQGVKAASFYWVGSEAAIKGIRPTYWKKYKHGFPFEQRIDSVGSWMELPENKRPQLVMLYFHEPDGIGHRYGPDSKEVSDNVSYLDSLIGVLSKKINKLPIAENINLIVASDHGMGNVDSSRQVFIDHYIDTAWFSRIIGHNPSFLLEVKEEFRDTALKVLQTIPHISAWKSENVPEHLNYGKNPRTLDFVLVADSAWAIALSDDPIHYKGAHGYDNRNKDMHAIFYASGPAFKKGFKTETFENVDIYPLACKILKLNSSNTDGSLKNVSEMLKQKPF